MAIKLDIKGYEVVEADRIYPLDSNGERMHFKYGVGEFRTTIKGQLMYVDMYNVKKDSKHRLTSKFETESGFRFTSVKLKNYLLKS